MLREGYYYKLRIGQETEEEEPRRQKSTNELDDFIERSLGKVSF